MGTHAENNPSLHTHTDSRHRFPFMYKYFPQKIPPRSFVSKLILDHVLLRPQGERQAPLLEVVVVVRAGDEEGDGHGRSPVVHGCVQ